MALPLLQITESVPANIFHIINTLAIEVIENRRERIADEIIEKWGPKFNADATLA
jgi:hypothetical protein